MLWVGNWSLSPTDRVAVDWRISEYELVDDNEASHTDKPSLGNKLVLRTLFQHYRGSAGTRFTQAITHSLWLPWAPDTGRHGQDGHWRQEGNLLPSRKRQKLVFYAKSEQDICVVTIQGVRVARAEQKHGCNSNKEYYAKKANSKTQIQTSLCLFVQFFAWYAKKCTKRNKNVSVCLNYFKKKISS